jgi:hypothetical protein
MKTYESNVKCKTHINKNGKKISICSSGPGKIITTCKSLHTKIPKLGEYNVSVKCKKTMVKQSKRKQSKRKQSKRKQSKRKTLRGGTVNPITEIGSMFGTLGSSLQSVVSSLSVPVTTAYNPSLPINPSPSSQFVTNELPQSIPSIFKSL